MDELLPEDVVELVDECWLCAGELVVVEESYHRPPGGKLQTFRREVPCHYCVPAVKAVAS